jgi:hypothetical protein
MIRVNTTGTSLYSSSQGHAPAWPRVDVIPPETPYPIRPKANRGGGCSNREESNKTPFFGQGIFKIPALKYALKSTILMFCYMKLRKFPKGYDIL